MDILHFNEQKQQKQEMEEYANFCTKEKSYQIKNDKKRELEFRFESRKLDILEKIGYPIQRLISQ